MQFVNTTTLKMVKPTDAEPGTLLFSCAQYERTPILVFETAGSRYGIFFGEPRRFQVTNLPETTEYFGTTDFRIEVDMAFSSRISPRKDELLPGAIAIWKSTVAIVAESVDDPRYITIEGREVAEPDSVNHYTGFANWRASIPNGLGEHTIVHTEDLRNPLATN